MPPKRSDRGGAQGGTSSARASSGRGRGQHPGQASATSSSAAATAGALSSSLDQFSARSQAPAGYTAALMREAVHTGLPKPKKPKTGPPAREVIPFTGYETSSGSQSPATEPTPDNRAKVIKTLPLKYAKKANSATEKIDVDYFDTAVSITSSAHSEPTRYTRRGKPIWAPTTHVDTTRFFGESAGEVPRVVLMLETGQGGTFAYGSKFTNKNSKGQIEEVLVDGAKQIGSTKVRHLHAYGNDVNFIGTSGCITCLGVYFEIKGNRCFCAHINAWMGNDEYAEEAIEDGKGPVYDEITKEVEERMKVHAKDHGRSSKDYIDLSLRLTCPHPRVLGFAVQDALQRFLGLNRRPFTQWKYHGFMVLPKIKDDQDHMQIIYLETKPDPNLPLGLLYDRLPKNFERRPYQDHDKKPMPIEWSYTAGKGWHVYHADGSMTYVRYAT